MPKSLSLDVASIKRGPVTTHPFHAAQPHPDRPPRRTCVSTWAVSGPRRISTVGSSPPLTRRVPPLMVEFDLHRTEQFILDGRVNDRIHGDSLTPHRSHISSLCRTASNGKAAVRLSVRNRR